MTHESAKRTRSPAPVENRLSYNFATSEDIKSAALALRKTPTSGKKEADQSYHNIYTLSGFVNALDLPQTARVVEGNYGDDDASTFSKGTALMLCSRKVTKMVVTEDAHKVTRSIPCDSSLLYVVLDPVHGLQGHLYNSVSELLSCRKLPKVVYIDGKTASNLCLSDNDQLIFPYEKEQNVLGRNCLVCYDQRDTKFKLPAGKQGRFSTKPDDIKMDIQSYIKHIRVFPYSVAKYTGNGKMFRSSVTDDSILTVTGTVTKQSVMVKIMSGVQRDDTEMVELPLDTPIKVQCLPTNSSKNEVTSPSQSANDTQKHPKANIKPRVLLPKEYLNRSTENKSSTQTSESEASAPQSVGNLNHQYASIKPRKQKPGEYLTLLPANRSNEKLKANQDSLHRNSTSEGQPLQQTQIPQQSHEDTYAVPQVSNVSVPAQKSHAEHTYTQPQSQTSRGSRVEENHTASPDEYDYVTVDQPSGAKPHGQLQEQLQRIETLEASNKKLEASNKKLITEVGQLQACVNELIQLVVTKDSESNIKQLSSMDIDGVVMMLHAMGLSEYEHTFRKNKIDGKILVYTDRIKLSQYGIINIKDQEALEDITKGRVSPLLYLLRLPSKNSENSGYVHFTKPSIPLSI